MFKWFWTISSLGAPEVTDLSILKISVPNNITAILLELISSSQTSRFMGKLKKSHSLAISKSKNPQPASCVAILDECQIYLGSEGSEEDSLGGGPPRYRYKPRRPPPWYIWNRYTRGILLLEHAPGAPSGSKAPPCVSTISWV